MYPEELQEDLDDLDCHDTSQLSISDECFWCFEIFMKCWDGWMTHDTEK